jgi:hypothetical protein
MLAIPTNFTHHVNYVAKPAPKLEEQTQRQRLGEYAIEHTRLGRNRFDRKTSPSQAEQKTLTPKLLGIQSRAQELPATPQ